MRKRSGLFTPWDRSVRGELVRKRLGELSRLEGEIAAMDPRIRATVQKTGTSLTSIPGVGPFIAAKILGEVGDPSRIRSKPAFAVLSGTAPLSASSGKVQRHRLNRGGNRQLNWALHYNALVQCRIMPEAQAYMDRQREAGKSHKEAMRCLKRHLSNVVYRHPVAGGASRAVCVSTVSKGFEARGRSHLRPCSRPLRRSLSLRTPSAPGRTSSRPRGRRAPACQRPERRHGRPGCHHERPAEHLHGRNVGKAYRATQ